MRKLAEGKLSILHDQQRLKVLAAFEPIPGAQPWGVLLDVPENALTGPAETLKQELDALNTSGTLLSWAWAWPLQSPACCWCG